MGNIYEGSTLYKAHVSYWLMNIHCSYLNSFQKRMTAIRITESPSTLKSRFLEKRSRDRGCAGRSTQNNANGGLYSRRQQNGKAKFCNGHASTPVEQRQNASRRKEEEGGSRDKSLQRFQRMKEKHTQNEVGGIWMK